MSLANFKGLLYCNRYVKTDVASLLVTAHLSLIGHLAIYSAIG